ncbi:MAG: hypothetical protein HQM08_05480 [Candidatus Riflebacteria bacterium]|nr:hypothetical protein [Candidatus Riflebacteria bacterium]
MKKFVLFCLVSLFISSFPVFASAPIATPTEDTPPITATQFTEKIGSVTNQVCQIFDLSGEIFASAKADADSTAQENKLEKATSEFSAALDDLKDFALDKKENADTKAFCANVDQALDSLDKFFALAETIMQALDENRDSTKQQAELKALKNSLLNNMKTLETLSPKIVNLPQGN